MEEECIPTVPNHTGISPERHYGADGTDPDGMDPDGEAPNVVEEDGTDVLEAETLEDGFGWDVKVSPS